MLGLIMLYYIGKTFYDLADDYQKNKWIFAFLGIFTYYVGALVSGIIIMMTGEIFNLYSLEETNTFLLDLLFMPFGFLACGGMFYFFKKKWRKTKEEEDRSLRNMLDEIGSDSIDNE